MVEAFSPELVLVDPELRRILLARPTSVGLLGENAADAPSVGRAPSATGWPVEAGPDASNEGKPENALVHSAPEREAHVRHRDTELFAQRQRIVRPSPRASASFPSATASRRSPIRGLAAAGVLILLGAMALSPEPNKSASPSRDSVPIAAGPKRPEAATGSRKTPLRRVAERDHGVVQHALPRERPSGAPARPEGAQAATNAQEAAATSTYRPTRVWGWVPVPDSTFYYVAFYRGGRGIYEARPRQARLVLPAGFRFPPGRYTWLIKPGFGSPSHPRYGRLIGPSSFVVRRTVVISDDVAR